MQRSAGGGQAEHGEYQDTGKRHQGNGHEPAYRRYECDRHHGRHAWRQHIPNEHVLQGVDGVGRGRDPAGQRSRHPIGKVPGSLPREVSEQVAAQVAGDGNKRIAGDPTGDPPQQVIRGNQRRQEQEAQPGVSGMGADVKSSRQRIDENLHPVLRAHRAADRAQHGARDGSMRHRPRHHIAGEKRKGPLGVPTSVFHAVWNSPVGCVRATRLMQRQSRPRVSGEPD